MIKMNSKSGRIGFSLLATAAGLVSFALPNTASAHPRDDVRVAIGFRADDCNPPTRVTRVWVPEVYRTVCDRVWVPAQFHVETQRIWREPVVEERCERVWVPDRWEVREIVTRDRWGHRVVRQERILVERGHYNEVRRPVVVREGCWETIEKKVIDCEGHWQNVERQELVCAGHWEERVERVPTVREHVSFGFGFRR